MARVSSSVETSVPPSRGAGPDARASVMPVSPLPSCEPDPTSTPRLRLTSSGGGNKRWRAGPSLLGDSLAVKLSALTRATLVRIQVPQPATPAKQSLHRIARPSRGKQGLFRGQTEFGAPEPGAFPAIAGVPGVRSPRARCKGEFGGNREFLRLRPQNREVVANCRPKWRNYLFLSMTSELSCFSAEQGAFSAEQGVFSAKQGVFSAKQGASFLQNRGPFLQNRGKGSRYQGSK